MICSVNANVASKRDSSPARPDPAGAGGNSNRRSAQNDGLNKSVWLSMREDALFGFLHGFVDLVEAIDGEQAGVNAVNSHRRVEHFVEGEIASFAAAGDHVGAFAVRADHAAAVDLDLSVFADQPEFDGIPEKAAEPLQRVFVLDLRTEASVVLQEIGENGMRVHRHVPEDIVENIRLGRVFERIAAAKPGRSGKHARVEHLEKRVAWQKPAHGRGAPSSPRFQARGDGFKVWEAIVFEPEEFVAFEIGAAGVGVDLGPTATN